MGDKRRKAVRDELLGAGRIVNVAKNEAGEQVALDHCPERKQARLYPGDDPAIRHLRPGSAAAEPQSAAAGGGGAPADLRPAAGPIEAAGRRAADDTPQIALGGDSYADNIDAAEEAAERRT